MLLACLLAQLRAGAFAARRSSSLAGVKGCYDKRSKLVHGSWYQRKKGFVLVSDQDLHVLRNLVRASILYFIALKEEEKAALFQTLDRAVFDRQEIE